MLFIKLNNIIKLNNFIIKDFRKENELIFHKLIHIYIYIYI